MIARAVRSAPAALAAAILILISGCHRAVPAHAAFSGGTPPDVVLVTIDTLRADSVGFLGNLRVQTPVLDRLAREGRVFPFAHAQSVVTLPSHVNILTGLYPYQHGVRDNDGFRLPDGVQTLATILKGKGYETAAFIGAFPLDARFGLSRGFDVYDQSYPQGANEYQFVVAERPAAEVVAAARGWLARERKGPGFLWVHLYDCHAPYRPPPPFDTRYASDPYLGEVAGVDAALGPLVEDLAARKGRPLLLVLTSDHGEALGDHGEKTHGLFGYEATLRVPLLLWAPGQIPAARDARSARHVDILPTILAAAGGVSLPAGAAGESLLDERGGSETASSRDAATSYFESLTSFYTRGWAPLRGVVGMGFKYVDLPIPELYDLKEDPAEKINIAATRLDVVRRLKPRLPAFTEGPAGARVGTSAETVSRLRSLGYLSGRPAAKERFGPEDDPKNLVGIDTKIHEMVDLYQRGRGEEAVALARSLVRDRPEMQTGYEYLSFLQGQAGDDAGSIRTLREAERRGLLDDRLRSRLGLLLAGTGRAADAIVVLEPLGGSADPDAWNAIGIARAGAGQKARALEAFEHALKIDPRNAIACQNIGITLVQAGDYAGALSAFDRAFALNDRLPRAWNGRGVALEELKRHAEAVQAWKRAVELDPGQFDALFNIGVVSAEHGDTATARMALSAFLERMPPSRARSDSARAREILKRLPP